MKFPKCQSAVLPLLLGTALFISCGSSNKKNVQENIEEETFIKAPEFNADSAYTYVAAQVAFGPRVPNTAAHRSCGEYLAKNWNNSEQKSITNMQTSWLTTVRS